MQWEAWHQRLLTKAGVFKFNTVSTEQVEAKYQKLFGPCGIINFFVHKAGARARMGVFRYEQTGETNKSYDQRAREGLEKTFIARAEEKLRIYKQTGNAEMLVDTWLYMMLEYSEPYHPNFHFKHIDRQD